MTTRVQSQQPTLVTYKLETPFLLKYIKTPSTQQEFQAWKLLNKSFTAPTQLMGANASVASDQLKQVFGPPSKVVDQLPAMTADSGKVMDAFNEILTLPYISKMKVNIPNETPIVTVIENCARKYKQLQIETIDVVRGVYTFALQQESLIPRINQQGGVSLSDFLSVNSYLVKKYSNDANGVAQKTETLRKEFEDILNKLKTNLGELQKQVDTLEQDIEEKEQEYIGHTVASVLSGILSVVFIAGAIASAGSLSAEFGIAAAGALSATIAEAVQAGTLAGIINNLKNVLKTAQTSVDRLGEVIPRFEKVVQYLNDIEQTWVSIGKNLTTIQDNYNLWNNPSNFISPIIEDTIKLWKLVEKECMDYIDIVSQTSTQFTIAPSTYHTLLKATTTSPVGTRNVYTAPSNVRVNPTNINGLIDITTWTFFASLISNSFRQSLVAPTMNLRITVSGLRDVSNKYAQLISELGGNGFGDLQSQANTVKQKFDIAQNALIQSVQQLNKFSRDFATWLRTEAVKPNNSANIIQYFRANAQSANQNLQSATDAENKMINYQQEDTLLNNRLIQKINEYNVTLGQKQAELREKENEKNNPPWWVYIGGIAAWLAYILKVLADLNDEINNLNRQIADLQNKKNIVSSIQSRWQELSTTTSAIKSAWTDLVTNLNTLVALGDMWNDPPTAIINLAADTWQSLSNQLNRFNN